MTTRLEYLQKQIILKDTELNIRRNKLILALYNNMFGKQNNFEKFWHR